MGGRMTTSSTATHPDRRPVPGRNCGWALLGTISVHRACAAAEFRGGTAIWSASRLPSLSVPNTPTRRPARQAAPLLAMLSGKATADARKGADRASHPSCGYLPGCAVTCRRYSRQHHTAHGPGTGSPATTGSSAVRARGAVKRCSGRSRGLDVQVPVHVAAVADHGHPDHAGVVIHGIDHPVVTGADPQIRPVAF
jgi:hypothetical protein